MSYSEQFVRACLQDKTITRLISRKQIHIDAENMKMRFTETNGPFNIEPIDFRDDGDMPVRIAYKDTYRFTIMLDDAIGYFGKDISKSVHLFSALLDGLLDPESRASDCVMTQWLRWRLIRLNAGGHVFVSAPFDERNDFVEVPGVLVDLFGRKIKLSLEN